MPSAPDELRLEWGGRDGIDPDKAEAFLRERGFTIHVGGVGIIRPQVHNQKLTYEEQRAVLFLIMEWDYAYEDELSVTEAPQLHHDSG